MYRLIFSLICFYSAFGPDINFLGRILIFLLGILFAPLVTELLFGGENYFIKPVIIRIDDLSALRWYIGIILIVFLFLFGLN